MAALTWRNVTGASAGNPASALANATSAFGSASRGALAHTESLRKGQAIKNEQLTQQAIADVLASGKPLSGSQLQNFAPGIDTSKVIDSVMGYQVDQSNLKTAQQNREIGAEELSNLRYENSDARRTFLENQATAELNLLEEQVDLRRAEHNRLVAKDERERVKYDGILAIQRGYNSTEPDGLRGQAMAAAEGKWEDTINKFLHTGKHAGLSPVEKEQLLQANEQSLRDNLINQEMGRLAPKWFAAQQAKYGLTESDLKETTYGRQFQAAQDANTQAIADDFQAQLKERRDTSRAAKRDWGNRDLSALIPVGDGGYLYNSDAASKKENTLVESDLKKFLETDLDMIVDEDELKNAQYVLKQVGGNKAKFAQIMNDAITDRERWYPWSDDEFDWAKAKNRADISKSVLRGILRDEAEKDPNVIDSITSAAIQRAQN